MNTTDPNSKDDASVPVFDMQYIYLDFDGEETSYRNRDLGLDFAVTVDDPCFSETQRRRILAELEKLYANQGIVFTLNAMERSESVYSTVFIGKSKAFNRYGSFFGMAETIDQGNLIRDDNAFVLLDSSSSEDQVISVIAHEIDHIALGMTHTVDSTADLAAYAAKTYLLTTTWNQHDPYNKYCPVDPKNGIRCVTGCTNTAAAQIIYYWIKTGELDFSLTLNEGDSYTSDESARSTFRISTNSADVKSGKYLSFDKTNSILRNFTVKQEKSIAALCWAVGVVQEANYSSSATSTSWSKELFVRCGFQDTVSNCWGRTTYLKTEGGLSDAGKSKLSSEILSGCPVGLTIKHGKESHAVVADGYNSSTGKFHLNFGWGGNSNGWYNLSGTFTDNYYHDNWYVEQVVFGIKPKPAPYLTITALNVSASKVNYKDDLSISFSVYNRGTASSSGTYAYIYSGSRLLNSFKVGSLYVGSTSSVCTATVSASSLDIGKNTIEVKVSTPDTSRTDSISKTVTVSLKQPDIKITQLATTVKGNKVVITYSIKNAGKADAKESMLKITGVGADKTYSLPAIKAGKTTSWKYTVEDLSRGKYTVSILLDYGNQIEESKETNNSASKKFTISAAPDFTPFKPKGWSDKIVTSVVRDTHKDASVITADDVIYVDFCIKNIGKAASPSFVSTLYVDGIKYDTYYYVDGLKSKTKMTWNDINIGKLSAGTHTITIESKRSGSSGAEESDLSNNTCTKTITVKAGAGTSNQAKAGLDSGKPVQGTDLSALRRSDSGNDWNNEADGLAGEIDIGSSTLDMRTVSLLAMPETFDIAEFDSLADSCLNLSDALSFGQFDTDALANSVSSAFMQTDSLIKQSTGLLA